MVIHWPTGTVTDLAVIEAVARLSLALKRVGARLEITSSDGELVRMIRACGLDSVVGPEAGRPPRSPA
ncbi:hypothetical protein JCM9957A_22650 [Kineosporia succinea]